MVPLGSQICGLLSYMFAMLGNVYTMYNAYIALILACFLKIHYFVHVLLVFVKRVSERDRDKERQQHCHSIWPKLYIVD